MAQRISAIVGDMYKVCERNLEPKRHMQVRSPFLACLLTRQLSLIHVSLLEHQMHEKSELARHVLEFFSFLLDAPSIMAILKDDDRQRLFLTLMLLTDQTEVYTLRTRSQLLGS
jgi:hypothetical protein